MQGDADALLREALDCYDDGAIEEGDLSVIGLTLEQFHHAVADRLRPPAVASSHRMRRECATHFPLSPVLAGRGSGEGAVISANSVGKWIR